jgi:hypothetical protein
MKRGCLVATVALWTSLLVTESLAVLLAPQYSGYLEINNGPQQQALEVWSDGTNRSISLSGSTASISNDYNFPYLSASASVAAGMNATAISTLLYGVRFTGPGDEVAVSILSSGTITTLLGAGSIYVQISGQRIDGSFDPLVFSADCNFCTGNSFSINDTHTFLTGMDYQVQMFVNLAGVGGSASGFVDPVFSVPQGFSIETSERIGNQVFAVPGALVGGGLPGLVLAFGGLAAWWRRRHRLAGKAGLQPTFI